MWDECIAAAEAKVRSSDEFSLRREAAVPVGAWQLLGATADTLLLRNLVESGVIPAQRLCVAPFEDSSVKSAAHSGGCSVKLLPRPCA